MSVRIAFTIMLSTMTTGCGDADSKTSIDLLFFNGRIHTVNENMDVAEALAIKDGRILEAGTEAILSGKYDAAERIDLEGRPAYPGFIDPHCHFLGYGQGLFRVELKGTNSFEEVLGTVLEHSVEFGQEWIIGRGWDQNDWPDKAFPTREKLDAMFLDKYVYLKRVDGHAVLVNGNVLKLAGIGDDYEFNPNLLLKENGIPTGILIDEAMDIVDAVLPVPDASYNRLALLAAQKNCFAAGLTSVTDCGLRQSEIELIDALHKSEELLMHVNAMIAGYDEKTMEYYLENGPFQTDKLRAASVKFYSDGALGSRGARLISPYADDSLNSGAVIGNEAYYRKNFQRLAQSEFQVCTHAIGDGANRMILDLYVEALCGPNDRRWRIEHAQVVHPEDMDKFGTYDIIPCVQATHATSDMYWAGERLGPQRLKSAYAYKDLLDQNGWLPNGSDFPVEAINPLLGFYAAVARQDPKGFPEGGFQPENALSREEALKAMTIWAALAGFDEKNRGSLEAGKQADIVVLDRDIMEVPIGDVPKVRVLSTYISGVRVH